MVAGLESNVAEPETTQPPGNKQTQRKDGSLIGCVCVRVGLTSLRESFCVAT